MTYSNMMNNKHFSSYGCYIYLGKICMVKLCISNVPLHKNLLLNLRLGGVNSFMLFNIFICHVSLKLKYVLQYILTASMAKRLRC